MSAQISLVLVTFRSSSAAPAAVASFRAETGALGAASEVVIVDHSEDAGEAARLQALAPDRLIIRPNRGFAAGVNVGVAASRGRTILVANPDIRFEAGAAAALLRALEAGWEIVGPQFTLGGWLFPPADLQTPGEQLRRWFAGLSPILWRRELARELVRCRATWEASGPVAVPALAGALLAFRREVFDRVGPWDERYFLYFEETDWERRALHAGLRMAHVPQARVEHAWAHAADPTATAEHFTRSRRRFFAAHHGWRGKAATRFMGGRAPLRVTTLPVDAQALPPGRRQWLLSPTALGIPAAGLVATSEELLGALALVAAARGGRGRFLVTAVAEDAREPAGTWAWEARDA